MNARAKKIRRPRTALAKPSIRMIKTMADEIVRKFRPQRIILFGSYAEGKPTVDSDVDLLVIMETRQRPPDQAAAIRRDVRFPFAVDLLVRTPKQVQERILLGDFFIREIMKRGKVLYETDFAAETRYPGINADQKDADQCVQTARTLRALLRRKLDIADKRRKNRGIQNGKGKS